MTDRLREEIDAMTWEDTLPDDEDEALRGLLAWQDALALERARERDRAIFWRTCAITLADFSLILMILYTTEVI